MALRVFLLVSTASVLGAILWLVMGWPPGDIGLYAGAAMILSGAAVAAQPLFRAGGAERAAVAMIGACLIGAASEISGIYMGLFGRYEYLDQWKPALELPGGQAFPVLLPVVWGIILAACYAFARQRLDGLAAVAAGAVIAACADLVSEAVLTRVVGFWVWLEPTPLLGAPVGNFFGWLLTSFVGCAWIAAALGKRRPVGREPAWLLGATFLGTATIGVTHGEPRGLWALAAVAPILLWRPKGVTQPEP